MFFFFQAEDGIRDRLVTGVQTCALPISVNEAVKVLGICERKVRELIAQDEIPHFRVGRAVRIPWQPLKEWMDNGGTAGGGK